MLRQEGTGAAGGEVRRSGEGEGQRQGCPSRGGGPAVSPRRRSHGGAAAGAAKRVGWCCLAACSCRGASHKGDYAAAAEPGDDGERQTGAAGSQQG